MADQPAVFVPAPPVELAQDEFERRYGPAAPLRPSEVVRLLDGAPLRWWVVGGWSLDTEADQRREHEDIEVSVLREELPAAREWLAAWHLWDIHAGTLRLLADDVEMPEDHEQIWVRRDAFSPWVLDVLLTPSEGAQWLFKKDRRIRRPLDEVVRVGADGVPRQVPEVTLLFKALHLRDKDRADFEAVLPSLDEAARRWLQAALLLTAPGHPWTARLA